MAVLPRGVGWHEGDPRRHPPVPALVRQPHRLPDEARPGSGCPRVRPHEPLDAAGKHPTRERRPSLVLLRAAPHGRDLCPLPTLALYPHSFCARLDITAGAELNTTLTLTNEDDHPFAIEAALHTYLHVGDVNDVTVEGLDGERYYDKVRERYATQTGDVTFIGPTDRVYTSTQLVQVVDPKLGRRIIVDKSGSGSTIVWNPWSQGAATMSDIGEGEWQNFVCVETAAVRERALTLWPGHPHIMTQTLAVETLD